MRFKPRLGVNPIIVKELRSRMRGWRAFAILTGVLLLLGGASYGLYAVVLTTSRYSNVPLSPQIGQTLFAGLAFLELMMVCFITPAVTAGSISSEREKLTYEMLLATPLRPGSVLRGKLVSALSYILMLIFAAIPMASLVFIFGGVAPRDMLKALLILVTTAVTLGVVGVFMSAWLGRTVWATALSYLLVLIWLVGPWVVYIMVGVIRNQEPPRWILVPNPVSALFSALTPSTSTMGPSGFVRELGAFLGGGLGLMRGRPLAGIPRPLYHYTLPLYGALALVLYLLGTRLVRTARRWRVSWKEVLVALSLLLVMGGAVALAFGTTADRYEKVKAMFTPTPMSMSMPRVPTQVVVEREVIQVVRVVESTPTIPPSTPTPTPVSAQALSEADQAAIYAAAVRRLYTVDHTFGDPPIRFPIVYLVRTTSEGTNDPALPSVETRVLPEPVQLAIVDALADLPAELVWVDDRGEVPMDTDLSVQGGGAILTLGNIYPQEDGSVLVPVGLFVASEGAEGRTYVLARVDGAWQVTGDTGTQWMK